MFGAAPRTAPTPEDLRIFQRNMRRIERWIDDTCPDISPDHMPGLRAVLERAMRDYLQFAPSDDAELIDLHSEDAWLSFLADNREGLEACGFSSDHARWMAVERGGLVIGGGAAPLYRVRLKIEDAAERWKADAAAFWATPGTPLVNAQEVQPIAPIQQALNDGPSPAPSRQPDGGVR
ncbi:MAG TPA: hypothetical protein VHZ78_08790 [Rhizomicrobium sp.]|jgi:hypothetical protein|nr:hypothetical protein [Rhizomicrobium sp.]